MARYDVAPAWFHTPRGRTALVYIREGTNDYNTARSCLDEDEYGFGSLEVTGRFLDIGGHIGTATLAVLLDNPLATAVIVEPLPENLELINRNLAANGLSERATVIAGAAGQGELTVSYAYATGENELHHAFIGNAVLVHGGDEPHRSVTRRGLGYADLAWDGAFDLVKIDCEGGEWGVLGGMIDVPLIVGELHPVGLAGQEPGSLARATELLGATHDLTFTGDGPWGFRATRR